MCLRTSRLPVASPLLASLSCAGGGALRLFECDGWTALGGARLGSEAVGVCFPAAGCRGAPGRLLVTDLTGPTATADSELAPSPALTAVNAQAVRDATITGHARSYPLHGCLRARNRQSRRRTVEMSSHQNRVLTPVAARSRALRR